MYKSLNASEDTYNTVVLSKNITDIIERILKSNAQKFPPTSIVEEEKDPSKFQS